jgi:hypothetical protein
MGVNCFWDVKDVFLKVGLTLTSPTMEWGCMDLNYLEGFNNLGMKRVSSLVQRHTPTSSIEEADLH